MCFTCKDKLKWNAGTNQSFQDFKTVFTTVPILVHPNFSKPFFLESDASDYALGVISSQKGEDK
jgi:hypothetical protein